MSAVSTSSETQGQINGARESLNGRKNIYGAKKSKERREEPLGTMSYQTSSKRSPLLWLLIGARKTGKTGTGLVRGSSRRSLLFFVTYFSARLDFPLYPLSASGSPRMRFRFQHPFTSMIAGMTGSGKRPWFDLYWNKLQRQFTFPLRGLFGVIHNGSLRIQKC